MIEDLVNRLRNVRKTGKNKWIACCPAHDDKKPSLAITHLDDGRTLIKCFSNHCATYDILQAVGLDWDAVFPPKRLGEFKPVKATIYATEALKLIENETKLVSLILTKARKQELTNDDINKMLAAQAKINDVKQAAGL